LTLLGLPLGAAILTRSVVALLALGIIAAHLVLTKRYEVLRSPWLIGGVLLALLFPFAWYGWAYRQHGGAFLVQHLDFLGGKFHGKEGVSGWRTAFNYPLALLKYYWPWLPLLLVGLVRKGRAVFKQRDSVAILLMVWVLFVFVPFSFAATRYPRYIMAVFPAFTAISAMTLHRWIPAARRRLFFNVASAVGIVAVGVSLLLPPKARAEDMVKIALIAEGNTAPEQRVLMYTYEQGRQDFLFQFIWYSNRYVQLADSVEDLAARVNGERTAIVIVDKGNYEKLLPMISGKVPRVLGESENLVCFRVE
jgi:4-amino-4-deoxy-L-arabinose transferase-like glycosyltransferase